jgi:hypothetical protein
MKYFNSALFITAFILLVLNFFIISEYGLIEERIARIASSSILFLVYLFSVSKKEKFFIIGFIFLIISDILLYNYESPPIKKLVFVVMILGYLAFLFHIRPYIQNLKTDLGQKLIFVVALSINVVLLYFLIEMAEDKMDDLLHSALFFIFGITLITLVVFAFSYSHRYSNKASFFFICGILGLVFSDISGYIAYYLEFEEFYYPDRFFYILGLVSLVKFALEDKSEGKMDPQFL